MGFLSVLAYHSNITYYMANYFEFDINFEIISFQLHHIRNIVFKDLDKHLYGPELQEPSLQS